MKWCKWFVGVVVCVVGCSKSVPPRVEPNATTVHAASESRNGVSDAFVLVACVRDAAADAAGSALEHAGVDVQSVSDRGITGLRVRERDAAHAKTILKIASKNGHFRLLWTR